MQRNKIFFLGLISILLTIWLLSPHSYSSNKVVENEFLNKMQAHVTQKPLSCSDYKSECLNLFKKIRFPSKNLLHNPPLKKPPSEMLNDFIQNGNMPISDFYINDLKYHPDASSKDTNNKTLVKFDKTRYTIDKIKAGIKDGPYGNGKLSQDMLKYVKKIESNTMLIIGTLDPWIEQISYTLGASKITTLDYTRQKWDDPKLEWYHVNDYLDELINGKKFENFDNSVSFSSIEHSGLGRYGDPLSPNGDFDAVKQVHCLLKPGGLFFLGLPSTNTETGRLEFNAHRIYGFKRLELMFKDWDFVEKSQQGDIHAVYILKKKSLC